MPATPHTTGGRAPEEDERHLPSNTIKYSMLFQGCTYYILYISYCITKACNSVKGKTKGGLPPIQIQPPSMGSVLDMLNIINGILFVQISQQVTVLFYSCSFAVGF